MKKITSQDKAKLIARAAAEKKGEDIVLIDMRGHAAIFDWFVLVSASSSRRINAISRQIQKDLSVKGCRPLNIEGRRNPYWMLMDYEDVIVNVFHEEVREFYGLDRLWSDAPTERFEADV